MLLKDSEKFALLIKRLATRIAKVGPAVKEVAPVAKRDAPMLKTMVGYIMIKSIASVIKKEHAPLRVAH